MTHGEVVALAGGGALLVAGGVTLWFLSQASAAASSTSPSSSSPGSSSGTLPILRVAPLTLPSYVTRRCGTAYVSFGPAPSNSQYIMVGQYTDGQLVAQYYQAATVLPSFNTAGSWAGGDVCGSSNSSTACQATVTVPVYNGSNAQEATLSGIAAQFNTTVQAIITANQARYPAISASYVQAGWALCIPG